MWMNNLSVIVRYSQIFSIRELQKFDIGHAEQIILMYLSENDNINQEAISRYFFIDKGSVAKSLSKLEKKGYIRRNTNPDNQREKLVSLEVKGREIIGCMGELLERWNNCIFHGLGKDDIEQLDRITKTMAVNAIETLESTGKKEP